MINFPITSQTRSTGHASSRLSSGRIRDRTRETAEIEPTNGPVSQYSHFERSYQLVCSRQRHSHERRENPGPLESGCALGRARHVCRVMRVLARDARAPRNDPQYLVIAALIT